MSTIAAISTAPISGGIGIVRMSGEKSFDIIKKIFIPINNKKKIAGYTMQYGKIVDGKKTIDEAIISFFVAPKSYTTENMCEINSHGGIIVVKKILELCLKNGAELAEPGEFTKRAFLNGRIDLSQAEAVADLINAKSNKEAEVSINQLEGFLSGEIKKIKNNILDLLINIEANIDYPEYDVEETIYIQAIEKLENIKLKLNKLRESFNSGKIIKDGIKTVILGRPNVGKSSLLNELAKQEKAIVTDIEGTTRDAIEEEIIISGIPFKIIDTAGIRKTINEVEKIGINKAKKLASEADLIIAIFDISKELNEEDIEILNILKNKKAVVLLNKYDLIKENKIDEKLINKYGKKVVKTSMINKEGIEDLYNTLIEMFELNEISIENTATITNERHKILIEETIKSIEKAILDLKETIPIDIVSINIKNAIEKLNEITGENATEDLIKGIFSKFCLGK